MAKIPFCLKRFQKNVSGAYTHGGRPRAYKKFLRKQDMLDRTRDAYDEGMCCMYYGVTSPVNPYPIHAKVRRAAWEHGAANADPLGDYYGPNY